jgi:hypothetical protein
MFAYILLTAAVAILTYLVSLRMLAPLPLTVQAALNG